MLFMIFSLSFGAVNSDLIPAIADESVAEEVSDAESAAAEAQEPLDFEAQLSEPEESAYAPAQESEAESAPAAPATAAVPAEEPYWIRDALYAQILSDYEVKAAGADGHSVIVGATLTVSALSGGVQGTIQVNARKVLANGSNAPQYDDASGLLLTPEEGLPLAGTSSDRALLCLIEVREGVAVYEATFLFGSQGYPDAPFTAFRTFVVLDNEAGSASSENSDNGEGGSSGSGNSEDGLDTGEARQEADGTSNSDGATTDEDIDPVAAGLRPITYGGTSLLGGFTTLAAADSYYAGQVIYTTVAWAGNWNGLIYGGEFDVGFFIDGTYLYSHVRCVDPGLPGPAGLDSVSYIGKTVIVTLTEIDRLSGTVYYYIYVPAPYPGASQRLQGYNGYFTTVFTGTINLIKGSANPSLTDGNGCYDLAGAEYGLYRTYAEAAIDVNRVHTFKVNSNGTSNAAYGVQNGVYALKEVKAPVGYELDTTMYTVTHGSTFTTVSRLDVPLGNTNPLQILKLDATTGEAYGTDDPNGLLLAGAEFTVRYWDGYFDTVEAAMAAGAPKRTWVLKTANHGTAWLTSEYLVSGSDALYTDLAGNTVVPLGTIAIQETAPPPGYLLPEPNPVSVQQIRETGLAPAPVTMLNAVTVLEVPHIDVAEKVDKDTNAPIADTEFTLYRESAPGAADWQAVSTHVTDAWGQCVFSPVAVGSYKLEETRANPLYAEASESGDGPHYFVITEDSTGEFQMFVNDLIQVSIEVYKKTIPLTSTALDGRNDDAVNNVGYEEYLYRFGARNTSSVRVDEFVITDSLEYVTSLGYRMTTLWTGTTPPGMDYDGLCAILYKTNLTDPGEQVSFAYDYMAANPPNANNPSNYMYVSVEPGWRIWQECVSTTEAVRLEVADLNLRPDEYIIGIRAVYGGVVKGFYSGTGWTGGENPKTVQDELRMLEDGSDDTRAFELRDWYYAVVASGGLRTQDEMGNETIMAGSIQADLFRNWGDNAPVLVDVDTDRVETRVIETFKHDTQDLGINGRGFFGGLFRGLPVTGDSLGLIGILALLTAVSGILCIYLAFSRRSKRRGASSRLLNGTRRTERSPWQAIYRTENSSTLGRRTHRPHRQAVYQTENGGSQG